MKKYLSLLIAILFTLSLNAGGGKAKIVFDSTRYDFGYIQEDKGKVTHSFKFTNDGDAPLIIIYTRSTCGCTASHFTKEPVAPAGTGSIDVTFDPEGRPGTFRKEIKVYTNARKASIKLIIRRGLLYLKIIVMKQLILGLILIFSITVSVAQPQIVFDNKNHDFGTFEEETGPGHSRFSIRQ